MIQKHFISHAAKLCQHTGSLSAASEARLMLTARRVLVWLLRSQLGACDRGRQRRLPIRSPIWKLALCMAVRVRVAVCVRMALLVRIRLTILAAVPAVV